jgi:hypothetical protein
MTASLRPDRMLSHQRLELADMSMKQSALPQVVAQSPVSRLRRCSTGETFGDIRLAGSTRAS